MDPLPPGHSLYSWTGSLSGREHVIPPGHTEFSWIGKCAAPAAAVKPSPVMAKLDAIEAIAKPGAVRMFVATRDGEWASANVAYSDASRRVVEHLKNSAGIGCVVVRTPSDYYSWPLEERARLLRCKVAHLCKVIVLENKHVDVAKEECDVSDWRSSRLLCFALQYTTKLDLTALEKEVRVCAEPHLSKRAVNLQVADETECAAVTGFVRNAVTPFGMQCALPVLASSSCLRLNPQYVWLGGGEVDLKLRVPVKQLQLMLETRFVPCTIRRNCENGDSE